VQEVTKKGDSRKKVLFGTLGCPLTQRRGPPLAKNHYIFSAANVQNIFLIRATFFAQK
jgi:hypothetical protein